MSKTVDNGAHLELCEICDHPRKQHHGDVCDVCEAEGGDCSEDDDDEFFDEFGDEFIDAP